MKTIDSELKLRALRELLLTAINEAVERITLFPAGRRLSGGKDDCFIEVQFRNGEKRTIEPGDC